jgi:hypothetical protein
MGLLAAGANPLRFADGIVNPLKRFQQRNAVKKQTYEFNNSAALGLNPDR